MPAPFSAGDTDRFYCTLLFDWYNVEFEVRNQVSRPKTYRLRCTSNARLNELRAVVKQRTGRSNAHIQPSRKLLPQTSFHSSSFLVVVTAAKFLEHHASITIIQPFLNFLRFLRGKICSLLNTRRRMGKVTIPGYCKTLFLPFWLNFGVSSEGIFILGRQL